MNWRQKYFNPFHYLQYKIWSSFGYSSPFLFLAVPKSLNSMPQAVPGLLYVFYVDDLYTHSIFQFRSILALSPKFKF